jgi:hypothetical protein
MDSPRGPSSPSGSSYGYESTTAFPVRPEANLPGPEPLHHATHAIGLALGLTHQLTALNLLLQSGK